MVVRPLGSEPGSSCFSHECSTTELQTPLIPKLFEQLFLTFPSALQVSDQMLFGEVNNLLLKQGIFQDVCQVVVVFLNIPETSPVSFYGLIWDQTFGSLMRGFLQVFFSFQKYYLYTQKYNAWTINQKYNYVDLTTYLNILLDSLYYLQSRKTQRLP